MGNYFSEEVDVEKTNSTLPPNCFQLYDSKISISNLIILHDKQTMIVSSDCQIKFFDIIRKKYEGNLILPKYIIKILPYDNRNLLCLTETSIYLIDSYSLKVLDELSGNNYNTNFCLNKKTNQLIVFSIDSLDLSTITLPTFKILSRISIDYMISEMVYLSSTEEILLSDIEGNLFKFKNGNCSTFDELSHNKTIQCLISPEESSWFGITEENSKMIELKDSVTGKCFCKFEDSSPILCISYSNNDLILTGNKEGEIKFWDISMDNYIKSYIGFKDPIRKLLLFEESIIAGTQKGALYIWKFQSIELILLKFLKNQKLIDLNFKFTIFQ
eukprot:gene1858-999_t